MTAQFERYLALSGGVGGAKLALGLSRLLATSSPCSSIRVMILNILACASVLIWIHLPTRYLDSLTKRLVGARRMRPGSASMR